MVAPGLRGLRKEIALALSDRERTLYETAKAVGRRSGDIQRSLRQMVDEEIVKASDPEPTRGTEYILTDAGRTLLEQELDVVLVPGLFAANQRFLRITAPDEAPLQAVFRQREFAAMLGWAVELGGSDEWLLGLRPGLGRHGMSRLRDALKAAEVTCREHVAQEVLTADQFTRIGAALDDRRAAA
jgi:DNA-binding PadR family transcriptional regulator